MARTPLVARPLATILREDIVQLREVLARAESERETWRASGNIEKHLEACSAADALELRLDRLQKALHAADKATPAAAVESQITFNGRQYCYGPYRYDRLDDAETYRRVLRSRTGEAAEIGAASAADGNAAPDAGEREAMRRLAITFEGGIYHLGPYRYDRLADAVAYASLGRSGQD